MIKLGDKVRDKYSGVVGFAVVRSEFINGCVQFEIQPKAGKDNKVPESIGVDVDALELIKKSKPKNKPRKKPPGGPNSPSTKMRGY